MSSPEQPVEKPHTLVEPFVETTTEFIRTKEGGDVYTRFGVQVPAPEGVATAPTKADVVKHVLRILAADQGFQLVPIQEVVD